MKAFGSFLLIALALVCPVRAQNGLPGPNFKKEMIDRLRDPAQRAAAIVEMKERMDDKKWTKGKRRATAYGALDPRFTLCPARDAGTRGLCRSLEFEVWCFFEVWILDLGICSPALPLAPRVPLLYRSPFP